MTARDRRLWPANDRIAHAVLAGQTDLPLTEGTPCQIAIPVADLCDGPEGALDRQLLFGERFTQLEDHDGWSFGIALPSGYVGYIRSDMLEPEAAKTHRVKTLGAHVYPEPDMKTRPSMLLPHAALLHIDERKGHFLNCGHGWVHEHQLEGIDTPHPDPVAVAELFLGVPYLWGGDSTFGIDCSGLVHIAMRSADIPCPRDSDQQARHLGTSLSSSATLQRGDAVFWKGHVGLMLDADWLIHANGYHMAVVREPLVQAAARIKAKGEGDITARRRPA